MHRSLFVLGLVLFWSFPALAQPRLELPEDVIGLEGRTKNIVVVLDTDELLIDGYSFDVCHDDEIISIDEENILRGSAIEELDFDTHIVTTEDGAWGVAAILAEGNSVGEDQSIDLELYVVTYDLDAIGDTDLTFCGDIEMANAVVDGEDTEFVLDEGNLEVREEGPSFRRGDVDGDGVVHPLVDGLRLLYWGITTTPAPPCMEAADVDANGSTSAIPDGLRLLSWGAGSANAPPDPGPETCGPNPVGDQEGCEAEDTCSGGGLRIVDPEDASFTLSLSEASGDVDDVVTITISLVGNEELLAFQFGVCHDDAVSLDVDAIAFEEPDDDFIFESTKVHDGGWTALAAIRLGDYLDVSDALELFTADYTVVRDEPTLLEFCDTLGEEYVVVPHIVVWGITWFDVAIPELIPGGINLPPPENDFLRGDANGNGEVSAIPDGLFLLRWGFLEGQAPPCDDAADVNDDGEVNALTDALALLRWGFEDGAAPPDPGTTECGPDPEVDRIGCADPAKICQ